MWCAWPAVQKVWPPLLEPNKHPRIKERGDRMSIKENECNETSKMKIPNAFKVVIQNWEKRETMKLRACDHPVLFYFRPIHHSTGQICGHRWHWTSLEHTSPRFHRFRAHAAGYGCVRTLKRSLPTVATSTRNPLRWVNECKKENDSLPSDAGERTALAAAGLFVHRRAGPLPLLRVPGSCSSRVHPAGRPASRRAERRDEWNPLDLQPTGWSARFPPKGSFSLPLFKWMQQTNPQKQSEFGKTSSIWSIIIFLFQYLI